MKFDMATGHKTVCHGWGDFPWKAVVALLSAFEVLPRYGQCGAHLQFISKLSLLFAEGEGGYASCCCTVKNPLPTTLAMLEFNFQEPAVATFCCSMFPPPSIHFEITFIALRYSRWFVK